MSRATSIPRLLTAAQVSEAAENLPKGRVYELTRKGLIPHVRIGASYRYPEDQLLEWIRNGGTASTAA